MTSDYGEPANLDAATWQVGIDGLVARPQSFTLSDLQARPRHEVNFALECSGNNWESNGQITRRVLIS